MMRALLFSWRSLTIQKGRTFFMRCSDERQGHFTTVPERETSERSINLKPEPGFNRATRSTVGHKRVNLDRACPIAGMVREPALAPCSQASAHGPRSVCLGGFVIHRELV